MNKFKPGGGNKPQPYVPAGNGKTSGRYTNRETESKHKKKPIDCYVKNVKFKCNFKKSSLVRKVSICSVVGEGTEIPVKYKPDSVIKRIINGYVIMERYYNQEGYAYLDIDYTCHGNPKTHPFVPHLHRWEKDEKGKLHRLEGEMFK